MYLQAMESAHAHSQYPEIHCSLLAFIFATYGKGAMTSVRNANNVVAQ